MSAAWAWPRAMMAARAAAGLARAAGLTEAEARQISFSVVAEGFPGVLAGEVETAAVREARAAVARAVGSVYQKGKEIKG